MKERTKPKISQAKTDPSLVTCAHVPPIQKRSPKSQIGSLPYLDTFEEDARLLNAELRDAKKPPPESGTLPQTIVSQTFWNRACEILPALRTDPVLRRFVTLLLFSVRRDRLTQGVLVPYELLATVAGVRLTGKFVAESVLKQIRDQHLPGLRWSDPVFRHGPGQVRAVTQSGLPPALHDLAQDELAVSVRLKGAAVEMVSGVQYRARQEEEARAKARAYAMEKLTPVSHPGTRALIEYLNARRSNIFTKVVRRGLDDAYASAQAMDRSEAAKLQALRVLRQVEAQPVPFYGPSRFGHSVRAFGDGLLALPREVRQTLTASWSWYDLKAAQLAIVAAQWKVPDVGRFLDSAPSEAGHDIWSSLVDQMGPSARALYNAGGPKADRLKRAFKGLLYGVVFGMGRKSLRHLQTREEEELGDVSRAEDLVAILGMPREEIGSRFVSHPAVGALLRARRRMGKDVRDWGGLEDAFGEWIDGSDPLSALAQAAQAEELFLLMPVVELARSTDDFQICAWLHDGFAINYANASKRLRWERRILQAVTDRASARGIQTFLEPQ